MRTSTNAPKRSAAKLHKESADTLDWMIRIAEEEISDPSFTEAQLAESAYVWLGESIILDYEMERLARRAIRIAESNLGLE